MTDKDVPFLKELAIAAPPEDASVAAARRARVVAGIERAIVREASTTRARSRGVRLWVALALAASLALGVGVAWRMRARPIATNAAPIASTNEPTPIVVPRARVASATDAHHGEALLAAGSLLAAGDAVDTGSSGALALVLPSDGHVDVGPGAHVIVDFLIGDEAISLADGTAVVASTRTLRVHASGADVATRGAAKVEFRIMGGALSLRVLEGEVDVVHGGVTERVHAPDAWPPPVQISPTAPRPTVPVRHVDASTLGEQNGLLQTALDARRRGDDATAIAAVDKLLARYPSSPLVQDARATRMRAYERSGKHAQAVAEASRYLADFPAGSARDEAKALIVE